MKVIALTFAVALASSLVSNSLIAGEQLPAHGSAAEAEHDAAGYDPVQQEAERKLEAAQSTIAVKETTPSIWDSAAGKQFIAAIQPRKDRWADFDQMVFQSRVAYSEDMLALMAKSAYAADIAYYLGMHPHESAQYAGMPLEQSRPAILAIEEQAKTVGVKSVVQPVRP